MIRTPSRPGAAPGWDVVGAGNSDTWAKRTTECFNTIRICVTFRCLCDDDGTFRPFLFSGTDCELSTNFPVHHSHAHTVSIGLLRALETRVHRPLGHPPVTVNFPRGDFQGNPARRVHTALCQRTSCTSAFPTSRQVTHHAHVYRETQGKWVRSSPTASPSYHGRRGATMGKDANSVTWYCGTTAPGNPMPPYWVDATPHWQQAESPPVPKGVQVTKVTMVTEHIQLTMVTDTILPSPPMPPFMCRCHQTLSIRLSCLHEDLFSHRCHSVLVISAQHLEDGRNGDLISLAVPEERRGLPLTCCQDDANR